MDFNVKKLAFGAGTLFTRAVQFTEEKLGQAEKTELDAHYETLMSRADATKHWTDKIYRQTEVLLQPNPSARIEEFLYEKLDWKAPSRITNGELLGQYMVGAAKEFGAETPYGNSLMMVGDCERRLGAAEREFIQTSAISFLTPLRNFLEGDWRSITKERRLLENLRLDLDACKARLKRAKSAEAKAAAVPDFKETRPRNYVLSASASALWSEEVEKAEQELRLAQTEFDRQAEVTRLVLEGISSTHVNHLRCLYEFVEAQAVYYHHCHFHMQELQKELASLPNAFALHSTFAVGTASEGLLGSPADPDTLKIEEVQAPASGTPHHGLHRARYGL
ncbi:endophilin-B2-like isoform X4 [Synchiropus splendidus]|uniref:endophilin-B2-like isoform X4 n=1 Tax=Synchiropus splendidus TaxID=270530 RepID=UPI00237DBB85|nr:endophilin-B2-like isoform X4 [Synchiropus splendidus]